MGGLLKVPTVDRLLEGTPLPRRTTRVPLSAAKGAVLAEPLVADRDLPPFDRVMMDGFALRHADLHRGASFLLCGEALAGAPRQSLPETPMAAMAVMTGAPFPEGADTVVKVEATQVNGNRMIVTDPSDVERGDYIHFRASDHKRGDLLVATGRLVRSVEIGIAASAGYADLRIVSRPRVIALGTGDELVPVTTVPQPHQIRRSNAIAVTTALLSLPVDVSDPIHLSDAAQEETGPLTEAIRAHDVVILSGAVSKGRLDWIPSTLDTLGTCCFHGVAQRPGKPMGVWQAGSGAVIFALPGNPVSTLVGLHRYVLPWLRRQCGWPAPAQTVQLANAIEQPLPLTLFCPMRLQADGTAIRVPLNNSGDYAALADSDGFIELPEGQNHWTAGASVAFYPWA